MSKIVKTWDGHQGELLYIKGKIAFIKESNGEVWFCLKTDIIDFDEINMEEYYVKDAGKITYIYGMDLEEHKKVIEKQQQRITELEQDLEFTTKTANELIEIKHKLEQELAELKEKAIVPKFKIGQEVFIVDKNYFKIEHYKIANCKILGIEDKLDRKNNYVRWYTLKIYNSSYLEYRRYKFKEKDVFATEQEAQDKLKEIQGNE